MGQHNHHVFFYYRWKAFQAKQEGRLLAQTFLLAWADEELAKQTTHEVSHEQNKRHHRPDPARGKEIPTLDSTW